MIITQEDLGSKSLDKILFKMLDGEEFEYKTRKEIYNSLLTIGLRVTENQIWSEVNFHPEEFYLLKIEKTHLIGLRKWVPFFFTSKKATRRFVEETSLTHSSDKNIIVDSFDSSEIVYHHLSGEEIKYGYIHLNPSFVFLFKNISSSLDIVPLKIICFNRNIFQGWLKTANNLFYSEDFKNYFNDNCKIGDTIKYQKDDKSVDGIFFHIDMENSNKSLLLNSTVSPTEEEICLKTSVTDNKPKVGIDTNKKKFVFIVIALIILIYILSS